MIETMFYFMIVMWVLIFVFAIYTKSPIIIVFAGMLFTLTGAMLSTEYITVREEVSARVTTVSSTIDDINYGYLNHTPRNDSGLKLIADVLFYGGFAIMAMSFGLFIYKWKFKEEDNLIPGA